MKQKIQLFQTNESSCSYLDDEISRNLIANPFDKPQLSVYSLLIQQGFRRSGSTFYRPDCELCQKCISVRVDVANFIYKRRFKRTLKKNSDIKLSIQKPRFTNEYFDLYSQYVNAQHKGGSMANPSQDDFSDFLITPEWSKAFFLEFRLGKKLVSLAVTDHINNGLSSVYTFYDTTMNHHSLGQFSILKQIELTKSNKRQYLYLGYWISQSKKMAYKADYQPLEYYCDQQWIPETEFEKLR